MNKTFVLCDGKVEGKNLVKAVKTQGSRNGY